jgi:hypothetical protein
MTASTPDGLQVVVADNIDVEAVDKIEATIPKNSVPTAVNLHPLLVGVQFITITATTYEDLTFKVGDGDPVTLDRALILMGKGLVALLGASTSTITFTNASALVDNEVSIMVGRDAIIPGN